MEAGKQNLPEKIYHLAHPEADGLVLRRFLEGRLNLARISTQCSICLSNFKEGDYFYACDGRCPDDRCDFTVDIACSSVKARVDFSAHEHLLFFLERVSQPQVCSTCLQFSRERIFRCLHCLYRLDLSCGPLPIAIPYNHGGHDFTMTLKDTFIDGAGPDDCWCDICEERRDPRECVYRSEDPPFTATINCLLPQIVGALQGDHGEVRLRSVRGHNPGTVIVTTQGFAKQESGEEMSTLHGDAEEVIVARKIEINAADVEDNIDSTFNGGEFLAFNGESLLDSLPQEEIELIRCALIELRERWIIGQTFKFSDEAFEQFTECAIIGEVDFVMLHLDVWPERTRRFVKVGSNMVYSGFVPLYLQVIDKQGDFTAGSPLSPAGKSVLLMLLLKPIQHIVGLQICEITDYQLCNLQFYLELTGKLDFNVKFAMDNLEQVARACYALKFVKARDDKTANLTQKIEQLERDIPEDKPKIEALKEQYRRGKESAFMKQCLAEGSALEWKNAGEFLGLD